MKDIYKLLADKQKQLAELQREVDALRMAAKLLGGDETVSEDSQSQPQMVIAILEATNKPLHISQIADQMKKRFKKSVKKSNLGVLLYRYAQRGKHFYKVTGKPNTYGLLKWEAMLGAQGREQRTAD